MPRRARILGAGGVLASAIIAVTIAVSVPSDPGCTTTLNSGGNVATAITNAASGATICLNAGTYSAPNLTATKTSYVTVKASDGLTPSQVTLTGTINVQHSTFLRFQGMTVGGAIIGDTFEAGANATHIQLINLTYTGTICYLQSVDAPMDLLIDGGSMGDESQGCTEGRIGGSSFGEPRSNDSGITIQNMTIGPGGQSDGIQHGCCLRRVLIQGNHFDHITETGGTHADGIQDVGSVFGTRIIGNWFDNLAEAMLTQDSSGQVITDNVVVDVGGGNPFSFGNVDNVTLEHNTFIDGSSVRLDAGSDNGSVRNNIFRGTSFNCTFPPGCPGTVIDHNMGAGTGTNQIAGTPTFLGGATPTNYAAFHLTSGSAGHLAASDGLDVGIR